MRRYILTEEAEQDLNQIWVYIAEQDIDTADNVIAEIRPCSCWRRLQVLVIGAQTLETRDIVSGAPIAS